jgi:hypothetical protein
MPTPQLYFGPQYGQFGASCRNHCCYAGLMDLYCNSNDYTYTSSYTCYTKTASTSPSDYPDNGFRTEDQWKVDWDPTYRRITSRSKAAWQNNIVCQIEDATIAGIGLNPLVFSYLSTNRAGREKPVVPLALNVTSRDVTSNESWYLHSGAIEVRAPSLGTINEISPPTYPLWGLVSSEPDSMASYDAGLTELGLQTFFRNSPDFESIAMLFRFQDPLNHMRVLVQRSPAILAIQTVTNGSVATLASAAIPYDTEVFRSGNHNDKTNEEQDNFDFNKNRTDKLLSVNIVGDLIQANLHMQVYDEPVETNQIVTSNVTISATSSYLNTATRVGFYFPTAEIATSSISILSPINPLQWPVVSSVATFQFPRKVYLSIYDDSMPEQQAEFDITDTFDKLLQGLHGPYTTSAAANICGALIAGGDKVLWIRHSDELNPSTESDRTLKTGVSAASANQSAYSLFRNAADDYDPDDMADLNAYVVGYPVREYTRSGSTWSDAEYFPYEQIAVFDGDTDAIAKVKTFPYRLAYKALPTFAQHSYPLACGYRMTGVSSERTDDGSSPGSRVYSFTATHEIIAGDVVWPNDRSLPYVSDSSPNVIYSFEETIESIPFTDHDPTEDFVRSYMTLYSLDNSNPMQYFESDPDMTAYVIAWDDGNFDHLGGKFGLARTNLGSIVEYEYNPSDSEPGCCAAAPGGNLAIVDRAYVGSPDPLSIPIYTRFRIINGGSGVVYSKQRNTFSVTSPPEKEAVAQNSNREMGFTVAACSDNYVYIISDLMDHQEAVEFAGHSLPITQLDTVAVIGSRLVGRPWLISWDATVRIPVIYKEQFDPQYRNRSAFLFFHSSPGISRGFQEFDCIKDSSLPYAPDFSLSTEGDVPFVFDYNGYYAYHDESAFPNDLPQVIDEETFTVPAGCTEIFVECWGGGGGGADGYDPEPLADDPDYDDIPNPVQHDIFNSPGTYTWTCPDNVFGLFVELIGPGGDGTSDFAAGGGAKAVSWFDVTPGEDYTLFLGDKTGPAVSYFIDTDHLAADRGESATISAAGLGGSWQDSLGTVMRDGQNGKTVFSPGNGGDSGGSFYTMIFAFGAGDGGTTSGGSENGHFPGGGGAKNNGVGASGGAQLTYRFGAIEGNAGGGGGGYANKTLSVTPGDTYTVHVGTYGWGQKGISTTPAAFFNYRAALHGGSSWFGSEETVQGAGGDSSYGATYTDIATGALGGGQPSAQSANVGDVTYPGGNGGDGNGIKRYFAFIGGGGGGAGGLLGPGGDGQGGAVTGCNGGLGSNDWNTDFVYQDSPRLGSGGFGVGRSIGGAVYSDGIGYGGGGGGSHFTPFSFTWVGDFDSVGWNGRIIISGTKTGQIVEPSFW